MVIADSNLYSFKEYKTYINPTETIQIKTIVSVETINIPGKKFCIVLLISEIRNKGSYISFWGLYSSRKRILVGSRRLNDLDKMIVKNSLNENLVEDNKN